MTNVREEIELWFAMNPDGPATNERQLLNDAAEEIERLRAERDAANRANEFLRGEVRNLARYIVEYGDHQYSCHCVRQDGALVECSCGWIDVYQQAKLRKKQ